VKRWRRGFYYIAKGAQVPIVLGYLDYEKKTLGTMAVFYPTDEVEADMKRIQAYYKNVKGKHPELFAGE
jgi:1-acyl-sn-glycerol-3-phosphate acyltransferase